MAPDDRDRNLDKALTQHFRPSAFQGTAQAAQPAGAFAAAPSAAAPALPTCPDAEILAAYHDGSLSSDELAFWNAHVLACSDCQLILEHLATPLDKPVARDTSQSVLVPAQFAQKAAPLAAAGAPASSVAVAPAAISLARPRKIYFRWLVPTGAIAAGLLTWAVIHESGVPKLSPPETFRVETAEKRASTPPPSSPTNSAASPGKTEPQRISPAPSSSENEEQLSAQADQLKRDLAKQAEQKEKDRSFSIGHGGAGSAGAIAQESGTDEAHFADRLQSAETLSRRSAASSGPRISQQPQQQAQLTPRAVDRGAPAFDKKALPPSGDVVIPREEPSFVEPGSIPPPPAKIAQAEPAPPSPVPASAQNSGARATSPKPAAAAKSPASDNAAVGAFTQTVTVESDTPSANMLRTASAFTRGPQTFNDPTHKSVWRVGPAGSIELSVDNGATWMPQSTGISTDLFTGFAPAARVCWIVGANGAILRTTDTGQHWLKLNAPVAADILGIHATDAFHATIWLIPDAKSNTLQTYKTSDGALTWSLVSNN